MTYRQAALSEVFRIALASTASVSACNGASASNGRAARLDPPRSKSSTIIEEHWAMSRPAIHPGEILAEELAAVKVDANRACAPTEGAGEPDHQIIRGKRSISGDTALRLGHWFGTSGQFWLNLRKCIRYSCGRAGSRGRNCTPSDALRPPPKALSDAITCAE
jgi:antitoxin HigA-1